MGSGQPGQFSLKLPLGVTGNTPDSGSGESWFDPRRGNAKGRESGPFALPLLGSFALLALRRRSPLASLIGPRKLPFAVSPPGIFRLAGAAASIPSGIVDRAAKGTLCIIPSWDLSPCWRCGVDSLWHR